MNSANRRWNYPLGDLHGYMMPGAGRSLAVRHWIRPAANTPGLWLGRGLEIITMDDTARIDRPACVQQPNYGYWATARGG